MVRTRNLALVFVLALLFSSFAAAKDIAVIVHKSNTTKNLPLAEMVKIFKNQIKKWPDGKELTIVMRDPSAPEMRVVVQKIFGMSPEQVKTLIESANQAHHGSVLLVTSDDALLKAVETNPGAIGVIDVYAITSGINVLKVEGKSPLEPGYVLHGQ